MSEENTSKTQSNIKYCFIARDPKMYLFETTPDNQFMRKQIDEVKHRFVQVTEQYKDFFGARAMNIHMLKDEIYFVCATSPHVSEEKGQRFLSDLRNEFSKLYHGNLSNVNKQTNLRPHLYNTQFQPTFDRIQENYTSVISSAAIGKALRTVDNVKTEARMAIGRMLENHDTTEQLLSKAQCLNEYTQEFEKTSRQVKDEANSKQFWMCSRKCILIFSIVGFVLFVIYMIISLTKCKNMRLYKNCL